jgi:exonuclease III
MAGGLVITIVFWNVAKRSHVLSHLACLAQSSSVDVFLLAECIQEISPTINELNGLNQGSYHDETTAPAKVRAITRLSRGAFDHHYTNRHMAIWTLQSSKLEQPEILVAGIHLPSKTAGPNDADQIVAASDLVKELVEIEDRHAHRNTILVGDFNMNPYDDGMTSVAGVHGLMTKELARRQDRRYNNKRYRRFYNPMWGMFGDQTPGPPGSYYWRSSVLHNTHWQMFDQLLFRPSVIDWFDGLQIMEHDGSHTLLGRNSAPDDQYLSDHLPVLFRLDI